MTNKNNTTGSKSLIKWEKGMSGYYEETEAIQIN